MQNLMYGPGMGTNMQNVVYGRLLSNITTAESLANLPSGQGENWSKMVELAVTLKPAGVIHKLHSAWFPLLVYGII